MSQHNELDVEKVDKPYIETVDLAHNDASLASHHSDEVENDIEFSPADEKRIIRQIDLRVTFACGAMYFISLLDRTNLGAANIAGMTKDLVLGIDNRYNVVALVFFIPYIIFEFPSNALVRKIGVRRHLATICLLWGCVMIGMGFVNSWQQMAGMRVLLGFFEAGFFPACIYLLSTWYVRYEVQKRYAAFYFLSTTASAFGGILAYGFMQMNGIAGIAGWRWIFIMEGIITVLIGVGGYFALADFPDRASKSLGFLNPQEIAWAVRRVQRDRGDATQEPFQWRPFFACASDVKLWLFSIIFCCLTTTAYSISYFLPIILLKGMGFSIAAAQCLTAPPYIVAGIFMLGGGWLGDKYHLRSPIVMFNCITCIVGLAVMTWGTGNSVRYFGVFLATIGCQANVPTAMAYQANNIRGQWKRAFGSATLVMGGGIGGISGSLVFRTQDAPQYLPGIYACIVANLIIILITAGFTIFFWTENKKAKAGKKVIQDQEGFLYTL